MVSAAVWRDRRGGVPARRDDRRGRRAVRPRWQDRTSLCASRHRPGADAGVASPHQRNNPSQALPRPPVVRGMRQRANSGGTRSALGAPGAAAGASAVASVSTPLSSRGVSRPAPCGFQLSPTWSDGASAARRSRATRPGRACEGRVSPLPGHRRLHPPGARLRDHPAPQRRSPPGRLPRRGERVRDHGNPYFANPRLPAAVRSDLLKLRTGTAMARNDIVGNTRAGYAVEVSRRRSEPRHQSRSGKPAQNRVIASTAGRGSISGHQCTTPSRRATSAPACCADH